MDGRTKIATQSKLSRWSLASTTTASWIASSTRRRGTREAVPPIPVQPPRPTQLPRRNQTWIAHRLRGNWKRPPLYCSASHETPGRMMAPSKCWALLALRLHMGHSYEWGATLITTNRVNKHWPSIFNKDHWLTTALLDRLLHNAQTVVIKSLRAKATAPKIRLKFDAHLCTTSNCRLCYIF